MVIPACWECLGLRGSSRAAVAVRSRAACFWRARPTTDDTANGQPITGLCTTLPFGSHPPVGSEKMNGVSRIFFASLLLRFCSCCRHFF